MKRDTMTQEEVSVIQEKHFDRVVREFRPTEFSYWKGEIDRHQYVEKVFKMCSRFRDALIKDGIAPSSKDDDPIWACAFRMVAITFSELPKLHDPYNKFTPSEYRIVKTKKCEQQKSLVRELAGLIMYGYE